MRQLSRQKISRQITGRQFYLKQDISRLKKKKSWSDSKQGTLATSRVRYLQTKWTGNSKNFELIMKQGTTRDEARRPDESCEQTYLRGKKSCSRLQHPCLSQE